jgi:hypothetical protein
MIICPYTGIRIHGVSEYDDSDEPAVCRGCGMFVRSYDEVERECPHNEDGYGPEDLDEDV